MVYCFGVMVTKNTEMMAPYFGDILKYVHSSFDKVENLESKDNVISCLFKLIMKDTQKIIPLE